MAESTQELVFAPLGGVGEIGMNLSIYGFGDERRRQWLIVDCGVSFAAEEHLPGVDLIMPDIRFFEERKNLARPRAHPRAMKTISARCIDLWPQLQGAALCDAVHRGAARGQARAGEPGAPKIPVNVVPLGGRFTLGPFDVEFVDVAHSIPESNALAIRTPAGTVLHTGDWKIDPTPILGAADRRDASCARSGDEGVLALIGDSTNAVREGRSPSEADVAKTLRRADRAPRRAASRSRHSPPMSARIRAVAEAARAADREVVVVGRAMERVVQVARETGYLDGVQDFRSAESYGYLPPTRSWRCAPAARASRAPRSSRIAEDEHPEVTLARGDRVIFSRAPSPATRRRSAA